ncbi:MAG: LptE family protein [Bacteroidota bacterium]
MRLTYKPSLFLRRSVMILLIGGITTACSVRFNFTGTQGVDDSLETLSIETFLNEAQIVVPYLAQELTQQMQDRFLNQSRLTLTSGAADIQLSGSINRYAISPVAISGNNTADQNRLTIGVKIKFDNNVAPDDSWEQTFSKFVDFDASNDFTSLEEDLINEILEQITQDVFSKSVGKW